VNIKQVFNRKISGNDHAVSKDKSNSEYGKTEIWNAMQTISRCQNPPGTLIQSFTFIKRLQQY